MCEVEDPVQVGCPSSAPLAKSLVPLAVWVAATCPVVSARQVASEGVPTVSVARVVAEHHPLGTQAIPKIFESQLLK
jgi:hypothetical protein